MQRRTPLRRFTPLKRTGIKRSNNPKPIRQVSKKRAGENREYAKVKAEYLLAHPICEACLSCGILPLQESTELHHARGRIRGLLCDVRFFLGVCHFHHAFIHADARWARTLGFLAPAHEFNTVPAA